MASDLIAALDNALQVAGEDIILRRVYGQGTSAQNSDVTVRARVLPQVLRPVDIGGEARLASWLVISPTQIKAKGWPGGEVPSEARPIPWLPARGDMILKDGDLANLVGRWRSIDEVRDPFWVDGEIVRIEFK